MNIAKNSIKDMASTKEYRAALRESSKALAEAYRKSRSTASKQMAYRSLCQDAFMPGLGAIVFGDRNIVFHAETMVAKHDTDSETAGSVRPALGLYHMAEPADDGLTDWSKIDGKVISLVFKNERSLDVLIHALVSLKSAFPDSIPGSEKKEDKE